MKFDNGNDTFDLAWEFLRRNEKYIEDWTRVKKTYPNIANSEYSLIQLPIDKVAEKKWGLLKYADPNNTFTTYIFWSQKYCNKCIDAFSIKASSNYKSAINVFIDNSISHVVMKLLDNNYCIKISRGDKYFQFFVENYSYEENISLMLFFPLCTKLKNIKSKISEIEEILNTKPKKKKIDYSKLDLLDILDYKKKGASQRELASLIFKDISVENVWNPDSSIRSNIRYRIKKAQNMVEKGYLKLI
ncbi:DUF2285 domain-containing protein [Xenorhabdus bovienii]|uniref:DUF2285 domain-containing protein n=1 Tax=Xenorhabdus bovienii str. feltiae Moldova TaxID=1398200 RepID=A0A077NRY6_XENBV|nr:DUF2285 domain-containing protein [Xenorhabdus bovienii]MDE1485696.1 DUF2285 domain-containing protein [Xenorhabdus bovienii]MDE1493474.1 DUF2285 domain-containing protein [Xenorhabdus bovienii]MDE9444550.1 DUF2285 domain-containing protein [Xenorhabdus bovienii]MDE9471570.1 DUF2285 domain-containing protein [Xenorhabdus bovienii]MDE9476460.1 DUF2285 domain-containing protein [Xenorhabdus bovienii]